MKLYTFETGGRRSIGAELNGSLIQLPAAYGEWLEFHEPAPGTLSALPPEMGAFLRLGDAGMEAARQALAFMATNPVVPPEIPVRFAFADVTICAPIKRPGKILCVGDNYRGKQIENPGPGFSEEPFFFSKLPSTVIGPGEAIVHPHRVRALDFEVELAVVIGKHVKHAHESDVMAAVAGFTILHDVSARDVQFKEHQLTLGKNFDTFCPLGPCIITPDELPSFDRLRLRSWLNGELMQDGSTSDWVFPLPKLLASLTHVMTLEPGDIVSTGTPDGVGVLRKPNVFLKPGDVMRLQIDGIGILENPVIAEG